MKTLNVGVRGVFGNEPWTAIRHFIRFAGFGSTASQLGVPSRDLPISRSSVDPMTPDILTARRIGIVCSENGAHWTAYIGGLHGGKVVRSVSC